MYKPELKNVKLPENLDNLIEKVAREVHETWAANRIKEGWKYGPERNDIKKETPCLVPYDDLPEIEKEYDRNTARTVVAKILEEGYKISK